MEVGQVGFHSNKEVNSLYLSVPLFTFMLLVTLVCRFLKVRTIQVEKKISEIVNRLNKTKEEKVVNLRELREERDRLEREGNKKKLREQVRHFCWQ